VDHDQPRQRALGSRRARQVAGDRPAVDGGVLHLAGRDLEGRGRLGHRIGDRCVVGVLAGHPLGVLALRVGGRAAPNGQ
jgi:hypothetical protein